MATLPVDINFTANPAADPARMDTAMAHLDGRLRALEVPAKSLDQVLATLQAIGLTRITDIISPLYASLQGAFQLGVVFSASSASSVTVGLGSRTFVLEDADRQRFAAAGYLGVQAVDDPGTMLFGPLQSYDRATGALQIGVAQFNGAAGAAYNSWRISATAAPNFVATAHSAGAYTQAEVDTAIADQAGALLDGVDAAGNTLRKLYALIAALTSEVQGDEASISALIRGLENRLRIDGDGGYSAAQQAQARANFGGDARYSRRRNRIVDPGMRVSQENGNNALAVGGGNFYASDGFSASRVGAGSATVQRIALPTPGGSPYRLRMKVGATNTAPTANDFLCFLSTIEGLDVADLKFGTAGARTIAIRLGVCASVAGTYCVALRNSGFTRSWCGSITIAPGEVGSDLVKTIVLTGDVAGTWASDSTTGLQLLVVLNAGSATTGSAGWQAGNYFATASASNLMATANATFDLFDVGLYDVTGLQSGVVPNFELGPYNEDLAKCQRYYAQVYCNARFGASGQGQLFDTPIAFPQVMRVAPTTALISAGGRNNMYTTLPTLTSTGQQSARFEIISNGAGDCYALSDYWALNARM